jgi:pilus assembly protein CpaB
MDRRFLTVLGVSLVFALVVSSIFYQISARSGNPKRQEPTAMKDVVLAAKPLPIGVNVKPDDVKVVKVPAAQFPNGAFSKVEEVIDRPVISNILMDEPLHEGRLAPRGSGLGLAPVIPVGMRGIAIRVNDVVGVSGFVLPGMRVDVLVTGRPPGGEGPMTTTVLQNILVLSAGNTVQADARGQPIKAPTVTLLVTPDQAEVLTLASEQGHVQLVLRNGGDLKIEKTSGSVLAEVYGGRGKPAEARPRPRPAPVIAAPALPPPPPPPPPDEVVIIRGTQKTVEVVNAARLDDSGSNR